MEGKPSFNFNNKMKPRALAGQLACLHLRGARRLSTAAEPPRVQVSHGSDGVVQVMLSRGSKMNALDMPMFRAIQHTARSLIEDKSVRAVVLHGEGRAFCAGLDVRSVCAPLSAKSNMAELLHRPEGGVSNLAQDVGYLWRRIPAPVIAVTHGVCLGGGFQIAMGADMRISSPSCKRSSQRFSDSTDQFLTVCSGCVLRLTRGAGAAGQALARNLERG